MNQKQKMLLVFNLVLCHQRNKKRSVVEVTKHETYDKDIPIIKGLFDIRMGTTDMDKICGTCGQKILIAPDILVILN